MNPTAPPPVRTAETRWSRLRLNRLAAPVSISAVAVVCFILGAATLHFDLPPGSFLERAFIGGRQWLEQQRAASEFPDGPLAGAKANLLRPGDTFDGYTL